MGTEVSRFSCCVSSYRSAGTAGAGCVKDFPADKISLYLRWNPTIEKDPVSSLLVKFQPYEAGGGPEVMKKQQFNSCPFILSCGSS